MNTLTPKATTLFAALLKARQQYGKQRLIAEDQQGQQISYQSLLVRSCLVARWLETQTQPHEHVGLMLPNTVAMTVTFFALHAAVRIPTLLNFTAGYRNISAGCQAVKVRAIITSKVFIEKAELNELVSKLQADHIQIIYLEDIKPALTLKRKLRAALDALTVKHWYRKRLRQLSADDTAVILFTSGSEGMPKGVALSHYNILMNCEQVLQCLTFEPEKDILFNALPMFHCFGLTVGTLLPLLYGVKTIYYPTPLHYRDIPRLIGSHRATIWFATDTFFNGYAKYATTEQLQQLKYVYAGAENLKPATRELYQQRFGVTIMEGYGVTETAPVISINTQAHHRPGSVGQLLPGMQARFAPVAGIEYGGRLLLNGPNVMQGYYQQEQPGILQRCDGWHDTGDIAYLDHDQFLWIQGRAKRFAKIAGEMVSLTAVEAYVQQCWPEYLHAVIAKADDKRGEQLWLYTNYPDADREDLVQFINQHGIAEIMLPRKIYHQEIPVLATGKINYLALQSN